MRKTAATVSVAKKSTNPFAMLDVSDSEEEVLAPAVVAPATVVEESNAAPPAEVEQRRQRWSEGEVKGSPQFPSVFSRGSRWKGGGNVGTVKKEEDIWSRPQFLREVLTPYERTPEYAPMTPPTVDGPPSFTLETAAAAVPTATPVMEVVEKPLTTTMAMRIKEVLDAAQQKKEHRPSNEERIASIRKGLEGLSFFRRTGAPSVHAAAQ